MELSIGTRGRTAQTTCTKAMGRQGETRAILYEGNIEYEIRGVLAKYTLCILKKQAAVLKLFRGVCLICFIGV